MDDDIYKNIEEYSQNKKRKNSIVFDNIIANMLSNNKFNLKVTALLIRSKIKHFSCFYNAILFCRTTKY